MGADGLPNDIASGFAQVLDPEILSRARRGDRKAHDAIYQRYGRACYTLAMRILGQPAAAEDVVQDVFLRVMDRLAGFRGDAPFGAWLKRMTANATIDVLRSGRRVQPLEDDVWLDNQADSQPAVEESLDAWSLLMRLTPRARAVVLLHELEGYTHLELAQMFGQSESYSKSLLARSLQKLQDAGPGGGAAVEVEHEH